MRGRKRPAISAFVMVKDGQRTIERCVRSLAWADELVVLDTGSQDATVRLAKKAGAQVRKAPWEGFSHTRNRGIRRLKGPWILVLDADEWLSPAASQRREHPLREVVEKPGVEAFRLKRTTLFLGKRMRRGGWGKDKQLRFFKKSRAWFDEGKQVHEGAVTKGPVKDLDVLIEHDSYPTLRSYFKKMDQYTQLAADDLMKRPHPVAALRMFLLPPWIFLRMALLRLGFLDGWRGLLLAALSALNEALKDFRALGLRDRNRARPQGLLP